MRTWLSLAMAYEHVRYGFGRMALSGLAVALGVALVVAIQLMNGAVLASFLDTVDGVAGRAALTVTAGEEGLTFAEEVVKQVAAVPGVRLAVPLVRSVAFPDDGSGELLTVHGVDLTHEAAVRVYHSTEDSGEVIDDLLVFLNQPDSIVLGREFAERRGLEVGSRLRLVTPRGVEQFTVRGLLEPQGLARALGGRLVVMDLYAAERAFAADGQINQIDILLTAGAAVEATQAAVAAVLPAGLQVEEPSLRKDVIRKTVGGFQAMVQAFGLLAVLAGFVICYSRLGTIFEARTWEVGLLRAVGLRRTVVFGELLKESLLLGAAGTAIGIPLGIAVGRYGLPMVATATALQFRLPVAGTSLALSGDVLVLGIAVGLSAAVLAAAMPALRLARKQPVAALTMRGRDTPIATTAISGAVGLSLLAVSAGLVLWQHASGFTTLGLVTTALVALASCACAAPLVHRGGSVLGGLWRRVFGPTGEYAADHLSEQPRRAALTVATLGIGLGAVLMFGMLAWSFEQTLVSQLTGRIRADLIISSAFVSGGYRTAPIGESLLDDLSAIAGVDLVVGEQQQDIHFKNGVVMLDAFDPGCFSHRRVCEWRLETGALPDALQRLAQGDAVLVSTSFAHLYGTSAGDTIRLPSPHGPLTFAVAGITSGQPVSAVILSRERYERSWNDSQIYLAHVALDDSAQRGAVEAAIARTLGRKYRLHTRSNAELVDYFASQARQAFSALYLMEIITFILVSIGLGDTLITGVAERTRQFGMMRAVGLRRSRLFAMVMLEGTGICLLGLVLAGATGLALGVFWVEVQFPAILGWRLDLHFPTSFALTAASLTLLLCLAGSVLPSLHAARLSVPQALRRE